jgi:hypothetical protein
MRDIFLLEDCLDGTQKSKDPELDPKLPHILSTGGWMHGK